jgi:glutamyl/glutaminyl-tRNA synthetase
MGRGRTLGPMPDQPQTVTRFAPSPTGHLHVGGARTALFCWAFAKQTGGRFMIRIEDTDAARSSDESARGILDDLAWLGIGWDDGPTLTREGGAAIGGDDRHVGPFFQAQRVAIYNAYIEHLLNVGRAYPAFESGEELDAARKAAAAKKQTFKYPRPADVVPGQRPEARIERARAGEKHVVRFLMPEHGITVQDQILGEVKFAAGEVDDFVIRKADGLPTYHFAVVIDDELMGVTHVLRAQEHLINTPRHVALQQALTRLTDDRDAGRGTTGRAFRTPAYAHLPLICNPDGSKMSKRDKAKAARKAVKDALAKPGTTLTPASAASRAGLDEAVLSAFLAGDTDAVEIAEALAGPFGVSLPEIEVWDYRQSGYLPEAIVNFLALLGWSSGQKSADGKDLEQFDMGFLAKHFALERIGKAPAKFDRVKLLSFNGDYLARLSDEAFERRLRAWASEHQADLPAKLGVLAPDRLAMLVRMGKPRCKTLREFARVIAFALVADDAVEFDPAAVEKHLKAEGGAGAALLAAFRERLMAVEPFESGPIDAALAALVAEKGVKIGAVAQAVRIAATGGTVSPPLGETLAALGRASVLRRIERCLGGIASA